MGKGRGGGASSEGLWGGQEWKVMSGAAMGTGPFTKRQLQDMLARGVLAAGMWLGACLLLPCAGWWCYGPGGGLGVGRG